MSPTVGSGCVQGPSDFMKSSDLRVRGYDMHTMALSVIFGRYGIIYNGVDIGRKVYHTLQFFIYLSLILTFVSSDSSPSTEGGFLLLKGYTDN